MPLAPGIQSRIYGNPTSLSIGDLVKFYVQEHQAERAGCFPAHARVLTDEGYLRFSDLKKRKNNLPNALSFNFETNKPEWKPILQLFENGSTDEWIHFNIRGTKGITCTPAHNIYVDRLGEILKIKAKDVNITSDKLLLLDTQLSEDSLQFFYGAFLGDGSIVTKESFRPTFSYGHAIKQQNLTQLAADIFKCNIKIRAAKGNASEFHSIRQKHAAFKEFAQLYTPKKGVDINFLNKLTDKAVAIWFADDGYWSKAKSYHKPLTKNTHRRCDIGTDPLSGSIFLYTNGFSLDVVELLQEWLNNTYGLNFRLRHRSKYYYLEQATKEHNKLFFELISKYLPTDVQYKSPLPVGGYEWKPVSEAKILYPLNVTKKEVIFTKQGNNKTQKLSIKKFDIEVADNHNYFSSDVLVSNSHDDVRLGNKARKLYSWAVRKGLPSPGQKHFGAQTFLHDEGYGPFSGVITQRYGRGVVKSKVNGKALITNVDKNGITFVTAHEKHPQRFRLQRLEGQRDWLLMNVTPTKPREYKKISYKSVPAEDVEQLFTPENMLQAKTDGCFPGKMRVLTEDGYMYIRDIVRNKYPGKVASRNTAGELVWKSITNYWIHEKQADWISFRAWSYPRNASYISCTNNHKILTTEGMKHAEDLNTGDTIFIHSEYPSSIQQEIMLGGLLGDGCLTQGGSFQFDQSEIHKDFAEFIYNVFKGPDGKHACISYCSPCESSFSDSGSIKIKSSRFFKPFREALYNKHGYKKLYPEMLKQLTPLALAIWFAGDGCGCFSTDNVFRELRFSTDSFDVDDVDLLLSTILDRYAIKGYKNNRPKNGRTKQGKLRYSISFYGKEALKLVKLIAPFTPPGMEYKLRHLYSPDENILPTSYNYTTKLIPSNIDMVIKTDRNRGKYGKNKWVYDLEIEDTHNYIVEGIVVSNSAAFYELLKDKIEVLSYRNQKETGYPIIHTERAGLYGVEGKDFPKNTVLRGEIYAAGKDGPVSAAETGGILNSTIENSLQKQKDKDLRLRHMLFDVVKYKGKDLKDMPYADRYKLLQSIAAKLPKDFHVAQGAYTKEEQRKLWKDVIKGKHPLTREGIVSHPLAGGVPTKVKTYPESDVVITGVFRGEGKYRDAAGGFTYALPSAPEKTVGKVGTGLRDEDRADMWKNQKDWIGRTARIRAQEQFPSGAYRAPGFLARHEDINQKTASSKVKNALLFLKKAGESRR